MAGVNGRTPREQRAAQDARDFILFCDGLEAGFPDYAARGRVVARELVWAAGELERMTSLVRSSLEARDRCLDLLRERIPA